MELIKITVHKGANCFWMSTVSSGTEAVMKWGIVGTVRRVPVSQYEADTLSPAADVLFARNCEVIAGVSYRPYIWFVFSSEWYNIYIVKDLIKALPANGSVNTFQHIRHTTIWRKCFLCDPGHTTIWVLCFLLSQWRVYITGVTLQLRLSQRDWR
jgi:hypothetical protein